VPSLFYTSGRARSQPAGFARRPGIATRPPRACQGDLSLWANSRETAKTVRGRCAGPPRQGMLCAAFSASVRWGYTPRWFKAFYSCRASGWPLGSAAIGAKRKISPAHPLRVCPDRRRARQLRWCALRSVEQRGPCPLPPSCPTEILCPCGIDCRGRFAGGGGDNGWPGHVPRTRRMGRSPAHAESPPGAPSRRTEGRQLDANGHRR
jgi:hypothetical protein